MLFFFPVHDHILLRLLVLLVVIFFFFRIIIDFFLLFSLNLLTLQAEFKAKEKHTGGPKLRKTKVCFCAPTFGGFCMQVMSEDFMRASIVSVG